MNSGTCNGDGNCMDSNLLTELFKCQYNCKTIKCPYFDVCNSIQVQYILDVHRGYCVNCAVLRYNLGNKETNEKYERAKRLQQCFGCCDGRIKVDDYFGLFCKD
eukprot:NODE_62_length_25126_cov_0.447277.p14 type:complete len:104 gc:universal NODE_62_length_25126_cov_0.447277:21368-21057(-)